MPEQTSRNAVTHEQPVALVLEFHHRRLDGMLDRVEMAVEIGSWREARSSFARLHMELTEHMRLEEDLMFPSLEPLIGPGGGPPAVMRAEHEQIRDLLGALERRLHEEQPIDEAADALETLLCTHNAKEERIVYPLFERHAPGEAYTALNLELRRLIGMAG